MSQCGHVFALIGIAGELATEYSLTGWNEGEAMNASLLGFNLWRDFRGSGQTETRQILQSVQDFILRHGDARFSSTNDKTEVRDRAGYWRETTDGRIFLFNSPALREAVKGFDIRRILTALDTAGWIIEHDTGKRSKKVKINGASISLYAIRPNNECES